MAEGHSNMAPPETESPPNPPEPLSEILKKCEGVIDRRDLTTCCFYASELGNANELTKEEKLWLRDFCANIKEARIKDEAAIKELLESQEHINKFNSSSEYWRRNNPLITDNDINKIYNEIEFNPPQQVVGISSQMQQQPQVGSAGPSRVLPHVAAPKTSQYMSFLQNDSHPQAFLFAKQQGVQDQSLFASNPIPFKASLGGAPIQQPEVFASRQGRMQDQSFSAIPGPNINMHSTPMFHPERQSRFEMPNTSSLSTASPPMPRPNNPLFNHIGQSLRPMETTNNQWVRAGAQVVKNNEVSMPPRRFDGDKLRAFWFIADYEACVLANRWNEATAINQFPNYLDNYSRHWFMSECADNSPQLTWQEIRSSFLSYYLGTNVDDGLRELFEQLKQRDETSTQFISLAYRFARRVYPNKSTQEILRLVVKKMRYPYLNLIGQTHGSLMELNQKCADLDEIASHRNAMKKSVSFRDETVGTKTNPVAPKAVDSKKKICTRCGRDNHTADKCIAKTKLDGTSLRTASATYSEPEEEEPEVLEDQELEVEHESLRDFFAEDSNCSVVDSAQPDEGHPIESVIAVTKKNKLIKHASTRNCRPVSPIFPVIIDRDNKIDAMFDTGSCKSLITYNLVRKHKLKFSPCDYELSGAGLTRLETVGIARVNIKFVFGNQSKSANVRLIVVNVLAYPIIIGVDLMTPFKIAVDLAPPMKLHFSGERNGVALVEPIKLPPRSQNIVVGVINKDNMPATVMIKPFTFKPRILTAYSVSTVIDNCVECLLLNLRNEYVTINAGTQIASLEYIEERTNVDMHPQTIASVQSVKISENEAIRLGANLNKPQVSELINLVRKHIGAFSLDGQLGSTTVVEHDIELLQDAKPHAEPLTRRPYAHVMETRRQVKEMLTKGIIEPSNSSWAAAYVVVSKKTGDLRICIDFRQLNRFTKKCSYPLPNVNDCLDRLAGNCYFSTMDLASGFWQLPMSERAKELTAFRTEDGHYQFKKMPFGLVNAPASFQKLVNIVFAGIKGLNMQVFIDDLCIATPSWTEHLAMLEKVFILLINSNLKLKASKCTFGSDNVVFLGHRLDKDGIRADPAKIRAISELPVPRSVDDIRRAHGLLNYYRTMVPNFAELAAPFTKLLKKNAQLHWGQEQDEGFSKIKAVLTKDPILAHYDYHKEAILKTDASLVGLAGILTQRRETEWVIVACCSRNTSDAEKNYSTTELEALAIVYAIDKFRHYLLGRHFVVLTDHCALCALNLKTPKNARLQRWKWVLQEFDFEIRYVRGDAHHDVDCLSRAPVDSAYDRYLDDKILVTIPVSRTVNLITPIELSNWKKLSESDDEAKEHYAKAKARGKGYKLTNGLLYYEEKLFVPQPLRAQVLSEAHEEMPSGHGGLRQTLNRLNGYWWPKMAMDARQFIMSCDNCLRNKTPRQLPSGEMHSIAASMPLDILALDTIGPLPVSASGRKHVLVGVDVFTKFVVLAALTDIQGSTIVDEIKKIIGYVGIPRVLLTDNAPSFINREMKDLQLQLKFHHRLSTARHHQGNAVAERAIQSVEQRLLALTHDPAHSINWDEEIANTMLSINTSVHATTGFTPYKLLFGLEANEPSELVEFQNQQSKFEKLKAANLNRDRVSALEATLDAQNRARVYFDRHHKQRSYDIGEFVLIRTGEGRMSKLQSPFEGPYQVMEKNRDIYALKQVGGREKLVNRHADNMRPYVLRENDEERDASRDSSFYESIHDTSANSEHINASVNVVIIRDLIQPKPYRATSQCQSRKNHSTMGKLFLLLLCINFAGLTAYQFFEPEKSNPLIWTETRKIVAPAPFDYTFFYRLGNPCAKLWEVASVPRPVLQEAVNHCNIVFHNQIVNRMNRLVKPLQQPAHGSLPSKPINTSSDKHKQTNTVKRNTRSMHQSVQKRQIFAAGAIAGYVVSNVWQNLFYQPGRDPADVNLKIQTADVKLQELYNQENVTQVQIRAIHDLVKLQGQLIENNIEQLAHVRFDNAVLTVLVSDVVSRIYILGALIDRIAITFRGKSPDLVSLIQLLDTPQTEQTLMDITPRSLDIDSIMFQVFDAATFQLQFRAHPQSHTAKVNRVIAFKHYGDLLNNITLYEYHGPSYVMYNYTNNCVKGISETIDEDFVEMECNERDGEDPALSEWRASPGNLDVPIRTVAHTVYPNTYIYCYPRNIAVAGKLRSCPPNVFFMNSMIGWNTSDYIYEPRRRSYNSTLIMNAHPVHYKNFSHYFNSNQALDKIYQLRNHTENLLHQLEQDRANLRASMNKEIDELKRKAFLSIGSLSLDYMTISQGFLFIIGFQMIIFILRFYCTLKKLKKDRIARAARSRYRVARSHSEGFYGTKAMVPLRSYREPVPCIELA